MVGPRGFRGVSQYSLVVRLSLLTRLLWCCAFVGWMDGHVRAHVHVSVWCVPTCLRYAQMGFDAGDGVTYYAHPASFTTEIAAAVSAGLPFCYRMSSEEVCALGFEYEDGVGCTPMPCTEFSAGLFSDRCVCAVSRRVVSCVLSRTLAAVDVDR